MLNGRILLSQRLTSHSAVIMGSKVLTNHSNIMYNNIITCLFHSLHRNRTHTAHSQPLNNSSVLSEHSLVLFELLPRHVLGADDQFKHTHTCSVVHTLSLSLSLSLSLCVCVCVCVRCSGSR